MAQNEPLIIRDEALELPRIAENIKRHSSSFDSSFLIQYDLTLFNSRLSKALNFTNLELTTPEQTREEIRIVADHLIDLLRQVKDL